MSRRLLTATLAFAGAAVLAACGSKSAAPTLPSTAMSLVDQLGGMGKVNQLAAQFGTNLSNAGGLSKFLSPQDVQTVSNGLVNSIASMSGMAPPKTGPDLAGALAGKNLDPAALSSLTSSLQSAATTVGYNESQTQALMKVLGPVKKG